jgi:hypothetical protein
MTEMTDGRRGYATHRPATIKALDRLEYCLETGTCGEGEKTIILLGSYHFGHSQNGHTSGEDIWSAERFELCDKADMQGCIAHTDPSGE